MRREMDSWTDVRFFSPLIDHSIVLDNGSQVWWRYVCHLVPTTFLPKSLTDGFPRLYSRRRWINIFITLGVWALELNIEDEYDDDGESMKSWKMD